MTTVHVNACIVGGGPAGMMLGLLLAKRGAQVLVLEGHETFEREFRGEVLQPSTAHLLDELGLLEYILAQPHSILEAGKVRLGGRQVGELSFKRIAPEYPYAIWMPQPIFLAALLRKAEPFPSFQCWMGAKVTKLIQEDGRTVGVQGLRHGREHFEVRADVVVGADGRHSAIAKMGGFKAEYEHHDFDLIWFTIEQPPGWSSTFCLARQQGPRPHAAEMPRITSRPGSRYRRVSGDDGDSRAGVCGRPRASARSHLRRVREQLEGLHAVLPARGSHSDGRRLGT